MKIEHRCPHCETITRPKVVAGAKKHWTDYVEFLRHLMEGHDLPPHDGDYRRLKNPPRVTEKKRHWYLPYVRGTQARYLVPTPGQCPCNICKHAGYNRQCPREDNCAAHAYWTAQLTEALDSNKEHPLLALMRKGKKCGARRAKSTSRTSGRGRNARRAGKRSH